MKVIYFTIEDISSGLFRTQVFDIVSAIEKIEKNVSTRIIVINRPWKIFQHWRAYKEYNKKVVGFNIKIIYLPLLFPLRKAVNNWMMSEILIYLLRFIATCTLSIIKCDLWHSRGYWTTIALQRNGYKNILFDPRSLWILENESADNLLSGSYMHKYWNENESLIVNSSRYISVVSNGMKLYYEKLYNKSSINLIPISVNADIFNYNEYERSNYRHLLGWTDDIIFVYSGSLGLSDLNISAIKKLISYLLNTENNKLLILTNENEKKIIDLLKSVNITDSKYKIVHPKQEEMGSWLSASDIGIHALSKQLDSYTRLGTKVVEYWSCGLPVIINNNVGAACDYIKDNQDLGYIANLEMPMPDIKELVNKLLKISREKIESYAIKNFSDRVIANKYLKVYKILSNN